MIKYLLLLSLMIPNLAQADFGTGLILGTMLSSGPRNTTVEVKDEFAKQVEQIESRLPSKYSSYSQSPEYTFEVLPSEAPKYLNYFKNGGYSVTYSKGQLTFDYAHKYQTYLRAEEQRRADQIAFDKKWQAAKPYVKGIGIFILAIWIITALVSTLNEMHRSGILGYFWKVEKKLLDKVIKDIETIRKK